MKSYKDIVEALKGKQHKIDKNKNGKIDAQDFQILRKEENEITEATVKTQKYSWGTMKTVHHGADFSIPLHPEHHKEIAKLKDEQEHNFKTEDGKSWTARRKGDEVHFQGANNGGSTKVKHADLKEEKDEEEDRMARSDYKVSPSGRKSHKEIVFKHGDDKKEIEEEMTDAQMKKREEIVKSMKKNMAGFKDRYGDKAKNVMYATATKMAMKEEEELEERNKQNAMMRKTMDASRGARFKLNNPVPDAEPQHKTAQAHNKAIGRALRKEESEQIDEATKYGRIWVHHTGGTSYGVAGETHDGKVKNLASGMGHMSARVTAGEIAKKHKLTDTSPKGEGGGWHFGPTSLHKEEAEQVEEGYYEKPASAYRRKGDEIGGGSSNVPFDGPYTKAKGTIKDKSGAQHTPMSRARDLARMAMKKQMKEQFELDITDEQADTILDAINEQAPVAPVPGQKFKDHAVMVNGKKRVVINRKNIDNYTKDGYKEVAPGQKIKEDDDTKFSYTELMMMLEVEFDKSGRYVHKGTYGTEFAKKEREKDEKGFDSDDKPTTNLTKRGRGRPAGSKSGARGPRIK